MVNFLLYETSWRRNHSIAVRLLTSCYYYIYIYIYIFCVNTFTPIDSLCRFKMTLVFPWDVLCRSIKLWRFRCHTTLLRACGFKKRKIIEFLRWSEKTTSKRLTWSKVIVSWISFSHREFKAFIRCFTGPISVHDLQIRNRIKKSQWYQKLQYSKDYTS